MPLSFVAPLGDATPTPIIFTSQQTWPAQRQQLDGEAASFAEAAGFEPKPGRHFLLPGRGRLAAVLFGLESTERPQGDPFLPGELAGVLPAGTYAFGTLPPRPRLAALGLALGCYRFVRYRDREAKELKLQLPAGIDAEE